MQMAWFIDLTWKRIYIWEEFQNLHKWQVGHPGVALCDWQDTKIHLPTSSPLYCQNITVDSNTMNYNIQTLSNKAWLLKCNWNILQVVGYSAFSIVWGYEVTNPSCVFIYMPCFDVRHMSWPWWAQHDRCFYFHLKEDSGVCSHAWKPW